MKIYIYIYLYNIIPFTIPKRKKKGMLFPSFVEVGPHSRAQSKKFRLLWKTCTRQRKEEEKELGNQKTRRQKSKKKRKRQPVFATLLFEFWPAQVYYLNSVFVLQPWLLPLPHPHHHMNMRFSLVFVGQITAQDSPAISLPV